MTAVASAARWLLAPVWLAQVFSSVKSYEFNPVLGSERLNRLGLQTWRGRLALRMTAWRRSKLASQVSSEDLEAFHRDGYVAKPDFLPPELFTQLKDEIAAFHGPAGEFKEGDAVTRRIPVSPELLGRMPALEALLKHPHWRGLTRYVSSFDAEPIVFLQAIYTHVDEGKIDPQTSMHIDTFHPTMKAWLFLHDVDDDTGPFAYVPGSHLRSPRREAWERRRSIEASAKGTQKKGGSYRITKTEMARLGCPKPKRFLVQGNTLVVADTYGFHQRRRSPGPSVRLEIWAYSRRNPFSLWRGPDFAGLSFVRGRAAEFGWAMMMMRKKMGLPAPHFRRVPDARLADPPAPWS